MGIYESDADYNEGGSLLKAIDLPEKKKVRVKISGVELVALPTFADRTKKEKKFVLHFEGRDKALALNPTNKEAVLVTLAPKVEGFEDDPDWEKFVGQEITIYRTKVKLGTGEIKDAIRVEREEDFEEAGEDEIDF